MTPLSSTVFYLDSHLNISRSWECIIIGIILVVIGGYYIKGVLVDILLLDTGGY